MYSIHHFLKKILFPERCISCKKDGACLCDECARLLPYTNILRHHTHFTEYILFPYHHAIIKSIIWELKYKNNQALRKKIIALLYTQVKTYLPKTSAIYLFSIPKSIYTDTKHRDFDHGLLLASEFKKQIDRETRVQMITDCFIKTTTQRQAVRKNRRERLESIKGKISATKRLQSYVNGDYPIVIIDDVVTTGGTRDEMVHAVRRYFSGPILFIALAH